MTDIKPMLVSRYHVSSIGLFGSFAHNEQTEASDIDLLIEFAPNTENLPEIKESIKQMVSARFQCKVDLAREKYLKPYFKNQILQSVIYAWKRQGELVFCTL